MKKLLIILAVFVAIALMFGVTFKTIVNNLNPAVFLARIKNLWYSLPAKPIENTVTWRDTPTATVAPTIPLVVSRPEVKPRDITARLGSIQSN